jgi:hypothetical protein
LYLTFGSGIEASHSFFKPRAFQEYSMFHTKELLTKLSVFGAGGYVELEQGVSGTRRAAEITGWYAIFGS